MTESGHLPPKETDEQRLPWHCRPRTLLGVLLAGLIASIPFAIRGYQLSLIPDVAEPFADLPPAETHTGTELTPDDPRVQPFQRLADRLNDDAYWLGVDDPTPKQHQEFRKALRHAVENGLKDAPPEVVRFASENDRLLDEWHLVLALCVDTPSCKESSRWRPPSRFSTAMKLVFQRRVLEGEPSRSYEYLVGSLNRLNRLPIDSLRQFSAISGTRRRFQDELLRLSEDVATTAENIANALKYASDWKAVTPEGRVKVLRDVYDMEIDAIESAVPTDSSPDSWSLRQFYFVAGDPDLAKRIVKALYTGYRSQLNLTHSHRRSLNTLAGGDIVWFDKTASQGLSRADLERAFSNSVVLNQLTRRYGSPYFSPAIIQGLDREATRLELLKVALACQLYLRKHGSLPRSLADLVPEYLPAIPEDPLTKSDPQLLYRRDGSAAVVYSRGWNGTDDGGLVLTDSDSDWSEDDFGILIRDLINHPEQAVKPTQAASEL